MEYIYPCPAPGCWKIYPTQREADLCTPLYQIVERYGEESLPTE